MDPPPLTIAKLTGTPFNGFSLASDTTSCNGGRAAPTLPSALFPLKMVIWAGASVTCATTKTVCTKDPEMSCKRPKWVPGCRPAADTRTAACPEPPGLKVPLASAIPSQLSYALRRQPSVFEPVTLNRGTPVVTAVPFIRVTLIESELTTI